MKLLTEVKVIRFRSEDEVRQVLRPRSYYTPPSNRQTCWCILFMLTFYLAIIGSGIVWIETSGRAGFTLQIRVFLYTMMVFGATIFSFLPGVFALDFDFTEKQHRIMTGYSSFDRIRKITQYFESRQYFERSKERVNRSIPSIRNRASRIGRSGFWEFRHAPHVERDVAKGKRCITCGK